MEGAKCHLGCAKMVFWEPKGSKISLLGEGHHSTTYKNKTEVGGVQGEKVTVTEEQWNSGFLRG